MKSRLKVVHVTPHLGGGIGKALLTLVEAQQGRDFDHGFVLLERPEKTGFLDGLKRLGCPVEYASPGEVAKAQALLAEADIVQLEWWNHPATCAFVCRTELPPMRLLVWSHVSGLRTPVIPSGLIEGVGRFVFTSGCSLQSSVVAQLDADTKTRIGVVSSGVGLDIPCPRTNGDGSLRVGYVGSLNFSKLHPRFVDYLAAVDVPGFMVRIWGDIQNRQQLRDECRHSGKNDLIVFEGYTADVAGCLASLDVFAYLLNPAHYGTGENALIEAMSAGVVPVVLDNPAERAIVENGRTGLVVDSPASFAAAIRWLALHPDERRSMGQNASAAAARRFAAHELGETMASQYRQVLATEKRVVDFREIFGDDPADWFLSCHEAGEHFATSIPALAGDDFARHSLYEASKGSLQHFCSRFPDDPRLQEWKHLSGACARP